MTASMQRRLEALEAASKQRNTVWLVFRGISPQQMDAPAVRAKFGDKEMLRVDDETEADFLGRVEAEALRRARPGCVGLAVVWPT